MSQIKGISDYKHNNQKLLYMESKEYDSRKYVLISYDTIVLEVVNGQIILDKYSQISCTTSKHITQCKEYLKSIGVLN